MQNLQNSSEKFGFCENGEFVPRIFSNLKKEKISEIFLTIYNANIDKDYKIPPKFVKNCTTLNQIFRNFITQNLAKKPLNFKKITKFCVSSNLIIFSFLQNKPQPNLANLPNLKVAKIIFLLRSMFDFGIEFDANYCFKNFVFDKISHKNKNLKITFNDDIIVIQKDKFRLGILPNFKEISNLNTANFSHDLQNALLQKNKFDMLYLVYPRSANFRRHIEIKSFEFEPNFKVKLVPYSINNKIF